MKTATGTRRITLVSIIAIVLIGELLAASAFAISGTGKASEPSPPSIAVVGDSYATGSHNRVVWPTLLAERTGWSVSNLALPGAGYVADGDGGHAFTYQVDRAQGTHARIILIVGGLADTGLAETGPVSVGAIDAINKIKVGGQRALVIGPTWYETPVPKSVIRVSDAVQKVADEAGVPYLDALTPPWLTPDEMSSDLSGPTDEGQSVIADKIAAWLRTQVAG